jgi:hypothetical protein
MVLEAQIASTIVVAIIKLLAKLPETGDKRLVLYGCPVGMGVA